ncbi:hypothetical protein BN8_04839 [Fibrisoma limi BUZ 3]|uniref:TIGR02646 family protein n=1 Tax=Fibrisoma limi BUZ 3 TaxID=1185876 RepID=I2GNU4_9BACT|nr:retron system putative HNH endonuclease [Fibrisoma limi]CCH55572.1 hypothetical protein BN8_04839 [Fibrisoma limi BUZ 3]
MKYITKQGAPRNYLDWCKANEGLNNEDYRCLQNPEKASLHETLIKEQGGLCAYTMRRIAVSSSHIEHIKPETLCRAELRGSDLDYNNLVACFPKEGMTNPFRYGAQEKGDWWEDDGRDFVSPLHKNCEPKFIFNLKGEVAPFKGDHQAKKTIEVLKLDHNSLIEDRERAIKEFIFGPAGDSPLSPKKVDQAIRAVCERNKSGQFREYCVAIKHALMEYTRQQKKAAKKKKHIQAQQKKK